MRHLTFQRLVLTTMTLLLLLCTASCSPKGVRMPKHRKRSHCDCPTFSMLHNVDESTLSHEPYQ